MPSNNNLNIYYQENAKQYFKRAAFDQVLSILYLITYFFLLSYLLLFQMSLLTGNRLIMIIFIFLIITPIGIYWPLYAFSKKPLVVKDDIISPPRVPIRHIHKKKNYNIDLMDVVWYKTMTSPSGDIKGILIKHPDFRLIDIHSPEFPIEAVNTTIKQLRKKIVDKEKSYH